MRGRAHPPARLLAVVVPVSLIGITAYAIATVVFARDPGSATTIAGVGAFLVASTLAERFPVPVEGADANGVSLGFVFAVAALVLFGWAPATFVYATAPTLVALDAQMVVRNTKGERVIPAEEFFIGPSVDITRMTAMLPGDLLTAIRIPATWAGSKFYFEKVRDRQVWDFPLVNVASALKLSGGKIDQARIVVNAVAAHPMRLRNVEAALAGKTQSEETASMAGDMAVQGAQPLAHNAYKIPLMRNLVKRAIRAEATS